MMKLILITIIAVMLSACGATDSTVKVTGGTTSDIKLTKNTVRVKMLDTGFCVGTFFGDGLVQGACVLNSNPPALDTYSLVDLYATRDLGLYPLTQDEDTFLSQ